MAVSPDGAHFATASTDETVLLWDLATGESQGDPLLGHEFGVVSLAYSPDSSLLFSGGIDHGVMITDLNSRQQLGPILSGHQDSVSTLEVTTAGDLLISSGHDGDLLVWPLTLEAWQDTACRRAGRNLTEEEWLRYFPGEPYQATCPRWK